MLDRDIIRNFKATERDMKIIQARADELRDAVGRLAALASRKALEDDCWRRAHGALLDASLLRHDVWAALPWWRRPFHRPPKLVVLYDDVLRLASNIKAEELREAARRREADAVVSAPPEDQPSTPKLEIVPPEAG